VNFFLYESTEFTGKELLEGGLRAGYNWNEGKYEAALFGRNITNEVVAVGGIDFNNLTGFLLISHQESYNSFALFNARPLEGPGWTTFDAVLIAAIGIVSSLLTALLLLHPRSPLKVGLATRKTGQV